MSNWLGSAASEADPESTERVQARMDKAEKEAKAEALTATRKNQDTALSTARARAAASGGSSSTLADYFTSVEQGFERENQWLGRSNVRSSVVAEHAKYYDSANKNQGFGFLAGGDKDWWA